MIRQGGRGRRFGALLVTAGLLALASAPAALGVNRVYWGNGGNDTISYANLDGSGGGGELNISGATPSGPRGLAIDDTAMRIYWANQGNDTISYANLDGSAAAASSISLGRRQASPTAWRSTLRQGGSTGPTTTTRSPTPTSTDRAATSSTSPGPPRTPPTAPRSTPRREGSIGPTGAPTRSPTPTSTDRAAAVSSILPGR